MPSREIVVQEPLISTVPTTPLLRHVQQVIKRLDPRGADHHAGIEAVGPSGVGRGGEGLGEREEVRERTEDEGVGVEEDELLVLDQTP